MGCNVKRGIVINPGTGPIENSIEKNAIDNMKHFVTDCKVENLQFLRYEEADDYDRFAFLLFVSTKYHGYDKVHIIHMPGLTLDKVRFMGGDQNPWDFPRLYKDWSSWLWSYALLDESDFKRCECEQ